jgi:hypothetical protein
MKRIKNKGTKTVGLHAYIGYPDSWYIQNGFLLPLKRETSNCVICGKRIGHYQCPNGEYGFRVRCKTETCCYFRPSVDFQTKIWGDELQKYRDMVKGGEITKDEFKRIKNTEYRYWYGKCIYYNSKEHVCEKQICRDIYKWWIKRRGYRCYEIPDNTDKESWSLYVTAYFLKHISNKKEKMYGQKNRCSTIREQDGEN